MPFGNEVETTSATSALADRWSLRTFASQALFQALAFFGFPKYGTDELPIRSSNTLEDVTTQLAHGHRLDQILGEPITQQRLKFEF
jgi:hypothetical protein